MTKMNRCIQNKENLARELRLLEPMMRHGKRANASGTLKQKQKQIDTLTETIRETKENLAAYEKAEKDARLKKIAQEIARIEKDSKEEDLKKAYSVIKQKELREEQRRLHQEHITELRKPEKKLVIENEDYIRKQSRSAKELAEKAKGLATGQDSDLLSVEYKQIVEDILSFASCCVEETCTRRCEDMLEYCYRQRMCDLKNLNSASGAISDIQYKVQEKLSPQSI